LPVQPETNGQSLMHFYMTVVGFVPTKVDIFDLTDRELKLIAACRFLLHCNIV